MNRDNAAAEAFLGRQRPDAALQLLYAEMLISDGKTQAGLKLLPAVAGQNTPAGYRASYLLALACIDTKQFDTARKWVLQSPLLSRDTTGQDLLADIALGAGQTNEAERIYQANLGASLAAREYFAKQAFQKKNWAEARRLTTELIRLAPDQLQFRENLGAIDRAESSLKK